MVVDASALVSLLVDPGAVGDWLSDQMRGRQLAGPELLPFEVANTLRRLEGSFRIDRTLAATAHDDLLSLRLRLLPYPALAERAWRLRTHVTVYDGVYVALAEMLQAPLITLDRRLAKAHGLGCEILIPMG